MQDPPPKLGRNFYGRTHGKTLRVQQKAYLAEDLARLSLPGVSRFESPARAPLDLGPWAAGRPVWLEIGFGGGEHLHALAAQSPEVAFIGCEPFVNGIAMLLGKLRAAPLANIRLHPGDVRDLFDVLPPASLARAFLNYPDPWPKARHHRRRFVTQDYLNGLARALKPGALFHIASDIPDYLRQAREEVPKAGFTLEADGPAPWADWQRTRYEQKALREGRLPGYQTWQRVAG